MNGFARFSATPFLARDFIVHSFVCAVLLYSFAWPCVSVFDLIIVLLFYIITDQYHEFWLWFWALDACFACSDIFVSFICHLSPRSFEKGGSGVYVCVHLARYSLPSFLIYFVCLCHVFPEYISSIHVRFSKLSVLTHHLCNSDTELYEFISCDICVFCAHFWYLIFACDWFMR